MKIKIDIVAFCHKIKKLFFRNNEIKNTKIYVLAADDNMDENPDTTEYKEYETCLNAVFDDRKVRNIAVSGSYGIGKSSIIHTYEKTSDMKFLYVSLMDSARDDGDRLEITLLRQILTNCFRSDFPRLRFCMIPEVTKKLFLKSFLLSSYLCLLICVILSEKISDIFHLFIGDLQGYGTPILYLLFLTATFVLVFMGIFYGVKYFKVKEINLKLSKENAEAESTASSCEESVLDEFRFDLIYVLENLSKDYDAIIFEDMDRLNSEKCISVFHQLREINLGLNARKNVKRWPFRFVYVVNDELMEKINQTKFFDYIMSVVPTIGVDNAKAKFQYFVLDDLDVKLLGKEKECIFNAIDASLMLKDYRTLKQIKNDYTLFFSIAETKGLVVDRCRGVLLGFVIYKVLWPQDYHLIRSGNSLVFPKWIENQIVIAKEWERRYGDASITHPEYKAIKEMKNLLTNGTCLKFIGYSRDECVSYYKEVLISDSVDRKRQLLSNDDDFICGSILFDVPNDIPKYINGIENEFILYLIRHYSSYSQEFKFEEFIVRLTNIGENTVSAEFVGEMESELVASGDEVGVYVFAIRCFNKLGYYETDLAYAPNAYGWMFCGDESVLSDRLKELNNSFSHIEFERLFSNFSKEELDEIMSASRDISNIYDIATKVRSKYVHFEDEG